LTSLLHWLSPTISLTSQASLGGSRGKPSRVDAKTH
jgi:hypothetical protein